MTEKEQLGEISRNVSHLYELFEALVHSLAGKDSCQLTKITTKNLIGLYCATHDKSALVEAE